MRCSLAQRVSFSRKDGKQTTKKTVWVEVSWGLSVGDRVRFWDEETKSTMWKVVRVYKTIRTTEAIHHAQRSL
jgi:hypothetical protein